MDIIKQIKCKNKAIDIINSCKTFEQCYVAERYINLYYEMFEDLLGFNELNRTLKKHKLFL